MIINDNNSISQTKQVKINNNRQTDNYIIKKMGKN